MKLDEQGLRHILQWVQDSLDKKVSAQEGKGLSENDFSAVYKQILDGAYSGADKGLVPDGTDAAPGSFLRADGSWAAAPETQSDWAESNAASPAFILNRPFGISEFEIVQEQTFTSDATGRTALEADPSGMPEEGQIVVIFDGLDYPVTPEPAYEPSGELIQIVAGNPYFITGNLKDNTGEPFCLVSDSETVYIYTDTLHTHTVQATAMITRSLTPEDVGMEIMDPISDDEIDVLFAQSADAGQ